MIAGGWAQKNRTSAPFPPLQLANCCAGSEASETTSDFRQRLGTQTCAGDGDSRAARADARRSRTIRVDQGRNMESGKQSRIVLSELGAAAAILTCFAVVL